MAHCISCLGISKIFPARAHKTVCVLKTVFNITVLWKLLMVFKSSQQGALCLREVINNQVSIKVTCFHSIKHSRGKAARARTLCDDIDVVVSNSSTASVKNIMYVRVVLLHAF